MLTDQTNESDVQNVLHCATVLAAACLPELNRQLRERGKKSHKKSYDSQPVTRMPDKVCVNRLGEEGSWPIMSMPGQLPWQIRLRIPCNILFTIKGTLLNII